MDEVEQEVHAPRRLRLQIEAAARTRRRPAVAARRTSRRPAPARWPARSPPRCSPSSCSPAARRPRSLSQAAALASRGAAGAPPTPDPDDPGVKLSEHVNDVYFPNWSSTLGWRPTGLRRDLLDLHRAVTVYYAYGTRRLAYTILSAPALAQPAAMVTVENGMTVRTLRLHGRVLVTWRRDGSTCVLTGTNVSAAQLRRLALTDPPPDGG